MKAAALSVLLLCGLVVSSYARTDPQKAKAIAKNVADVTSRTGVNWLTTAQLKALDLSKNTRPIMYFFNWRTCHVCRDLIEDMAYHKSQIADVSRGFLCVDVLDEDNWEYGHEYEPDGNDYIPRIMFADPDGTLRADIVNPKNEPNQAYYYWTADMVTEKMREVGKIYTSANAGSFKREI